MQALQTYIEKATFCHQQNMAATGIAKIFLIAKTECWLSK